MCFPLVLSNSKSHNDFLNTHIHHHSFVIPHKGQPQQSQTYTHPSLHRGNIFLILLGKWGKSSGTSQGFWWPYLPSTHRSICTRISSVIPNSCLFFLITFPKNYFFLFPKAKPLLPSKTIMAKGLQWTIFCPNFTKTLQFLCSLAIKAGKHLKLWEVNLAAASFSNGLGLGIGFYVYFSGHFRDPSESHKPILLIS